MPIRPDLSDRAREALAVLQHVTDGERLAVIEALEDDLARARELLSTQAAAELAGVPYDRLRLSATLVEPLLPRQVRARVAITTPGKRDTFGWVERDLAGWRSS